MKSTSQKPIVITGGVGFIGSGVVRYLNDKKMTNLVLVDDLGTTDKWKNLNGKNFTDIVRIEQLFDWLQGREKEIGGIIHLGACTDTTERNASFLLENNFRYTLRLCEYALKNSIRFIYASSAATYGDGTLGFSDDHALLEQYRPMNMYGYSKHLFDLWALREGVLDKIVGLKYFNVFGPNEYHKERMASAIVRMVSEMVQHGKKEIRLYKSNDPAKFPDGEQKRDFIYVKDAVAMTCAFLENSACGIFNIGTGKAASWKELATCVFKALKIRPRILYVDLPDELQGIYQNFTEADMKKCCAALGDKAVTRPFEEAVTDYVQNYLVKGLRW